MNQYIRTYTCLNNNPGHGRKIPISGSSNKYTLDEQCRLDFGKDYGLCQNVSNEAPFFQSRLCSVIDENNRILGKGNCVPKSVRIAFQSAFPLGGTLAQSSEIIDRNF